MKKVFCSIIDFIKNNLIIKIIYNIFKFLIFTLLVLYIAFVIYQRVSGNAPLFGYRVFTVASGSMTPAYNINDVIFVKEVDVDTLKVGDDIAYNGERAGFEGLIITHRIIDIEKTSDGGRRIFTKGIANENEDPSIKDDQINGKVLGKVIIINQMNHAVKSTWGFFFLIFLPLFLVIVLEIIETIIEDKIDNNKIRKRVRNKLNIDDDDEDEDDDEYEDDEDEEDDDDSEEIEEEEESEIEDSTDDEKEIIEKVDNTSLDDDILEVLVEPSDEGEDKNEEDDEEII